MNRILTAFSAALVAAPAYAGGLAPERSPRPIERPPLVANVCQHIPWTECGEVRGDGPVAAPTRTPSAPRPVPATPTLPDVVVVEPPGKGNASANNGKGGNYDKTGHTDNGAGVGKGRN